MQVAEYNVLLIVAFAVIVAVPADPPVKVMLVPLLEEAELKDTTLLLLVVHEIVLSLLDVAEIVVVLPVTIVSVDLLIETPTVGVPASFVP